MLDSTPASILNVSASPAPRITGSWLAKNRLSEAARVAIALRLLNGNEPVTGLTIAQIARLCRVPRAKIDKHFKRHRNVGEALARAFGRLSSEQQIAFIRAIGIEVTWDALIQAL
jgi:hypothetical protein